MIRRYSHIGIENSRTGQHLEETDFFRSMTYLKNGHEVRIGEGCIMDINEIRVIVSIVKETDSNGNVLDADHLKIPIQNIKEWESVNSDELRKVKIADAMSGDCMIILTNAPAEAVKKWISDYNTEQENGISTYFDSLQKKHYVKVLYDSGEDPEEAMDIVGFDEIYDLYDT